jgi:hypothetical protein
MGNFAKRVALCVYTGVGLFLVACSGGGGKPTTTPQTTTYTLTINSATPSAGVPITVSPADNNAASNGSTSFTRTYNSGASVTLTAAATAGGNAFTSWSGCSSTATVTCTVSMSANTTVTANYAAARIATPTIVVTPSAASITTAQSLQITVAVSGPAGVATPTGSVLLSTDNFSSAPTPLTSGSVAFNIPQGTLSVGSRTLTATYTPDAASSAVYAGASGTGTVIVTAPALITPTVTVTPAQTSVVTAQTLAVTVNVNGGSGNQPPTGSVMLSGGSFTSPATNLSAGSAAITIPANNLPAGTDTLKAAYTPDASSSTVYSGASGTATITVVAGQVNSVSVTPNPATATIGGTQQFAATVNGSGTFNKSVAWSVTAPAGSPQSPGTITAAGLYTTPYPAPATVTVTATSTQDTTKSGSVTVTLNSPVAATGPALSVDTGSKTHAISPDIYGVNAYDLDTTSATNANIPVARWGGDNTSRYNYQLKTSSAASDFYFENTTGATGIWPTGQFDDLVSTAATYKIKVVGTANVLGWVAKDGSSCSFPKATYPSQFAFDPTSGSCGDGEYSNQAPITGNDPTAASVAITSSTWDSAWVNHVTSTAGNAASNKGVSIWDLDNEPEYWDSVHRDVHPLPSSYDEVTVNGIAAASTIKTADPTAQVSGPVVSNWWDYFYSRKDIELGWTKGAPCYQPWGDPVDRTAHSGIPFIEYYLQQFKAAGATAGKRLLDYVDLHAYFAGTYNKASVGLTTAGDTAEQQVRMNSTRVFWDPTYTDPNYTQPNYTTDANYTSSCNVPLQAPQLIPMMKTWVANDYPGTKLAIDEYNFGGMESINGAVTEADILGIFGREGLDLGALWPTTNYSQQGPGIMAFAIYRNYDGSNSNFGDTALASTSADQGKLSVYGAVRTSDNAVTVVVINKTYGDLTSTVSLPSLSTSTTSAQAYLYSNAQVQTGKIAAQPNVTVNPPAGAGAPSTITMKFPAQSITLLVIPD